MKNTKTQPKVAAAVAFFETQRARSKVRKTKKRAQRAVLKSLIDAKVAPEHRS